MHPKASPRRVRGDTAVQRAVLALALAAHPKPLTIPGLAAEIEWAEHAVRDLVGVGLLICGGLSVRPSLAAIHFDALELP